jgi:hypothetical protein
MMVLEELPEILHMLQVLRLLLIPQLLSFSVKHHDYSILLMLLNTIEKVFVLVSIVSRISQNL